VKPAAKTNRTKPLTTKAASTFTLEARRVFKALGHDADGRCPVGVDRKSNQLIMMDQGAPEKLQFATLAAKTRARCFAPSVHAMGDPERLKEGLSNLRTLPACGWKWCRDKDKLTKEQWSTLLSAVKDLKAHGLDPDGYAVAWGAEVYTDLCRQVEAYPAYKDFAALVDKTPGAEGHLSPELRQGLEATRAVSFAETGGSSVNDYAIQGFLNLVYGNIYKGDATVAAAILLLFFLFGVGDDEGVDYSDLKGAFQTAWQHKNRLSIRDDVTRAAPMANTLEKDSAMAREALEDLRLATAGLFDKMASSVNRENARQRPIAQKAIRDAAKQQRRNGAIAKNVPQGMATGDEVEKRFLRSTLPVNLRASRIAMDMKKDWRKGKPWKAIGDRRVRQIIEDRKLKEAATKAEIR
jgi:hypothetical protein